MLQTDLSQLSIAILVIVSVAIRAWFAYKAVSSREEGKTKRLEIAVHESKPIERERIIRALQATEASASDSPDPHDESIRSRFILWLLRR